MRDLENYLKKLVAFKTVDGNTQAFTECLDWLETFFSDRFMYTHRVASKGYESLIATTQATKKPRALLQAHLDVVPAHSEGFSLREKDGKLYGRGTFDMKFAIAVFMALVDELQNELKNLDFGIMITTDEEMGGEDGVKFLLENGWSADVCILPDGGDNWRLEETAKGFWLLEATAKGKTAHGSRPWDGINAIDELVDFLEDAKRLFKDQNTTTPTLTVVSIEGGEALNQVPERAIAKLDIRTTEVNNHHNLMKQLEKFAEQRNITLSKRFSGKPSFTDTKRPYAKAFLNHLEQITGAEPELTQSLGSSDGRYFAEKDIEVLIMRPEGGGAHATDEWIRTSDLGKYKQLLINYLRDIAFNSGNTQ